MSSLVAPPAGLPAETIVIARNFFIMVAVIALGIPLIRAFSKRWERGPQIPAPASPDIVARLDRIEQAVEAVAIEVERIAEAQRFTAKLMADQQRALPHTDQPR